MAHPDSFKAAVACTCQQGRGGAAVASQRHAAPGRGTATDRRSTAGTCRAPRTCTTSPRSPARWDTRHRHAQVTAYRASTAAGAGKWLAHLVRLGYNDERHRADPHAAVREEENLGPALTRVLGEPPRRLQRRARGSSEPDCARNTQHSLTATRSATATSTIGALVLAV